MFYSYPYALRFELSNPNANSDKEYFLSGIERAKVLFNTIFRASNEILIKVDATPDKDLKVALSAAEMQRVRARTLSPFDEEELLDNPVQYHYSYYYKIGTHRLPQELLFDRIVYGRLAHSTYIFDLEQFMMFHIYDDRGADLIAPAKDILAPYYLSLNEYLLNYDRSIMDKTFNE